MGRPIAQFLTALGRLSVVLLSVATPAGAQTRMWDPTNSDSVCETLRAAIDAAPAGDAAAAQEAAQVRGEYERLAARADAIGCNNRPFLFFGSPPPPECGGLQRRLAGLRAQYESLRARAGAIGRRQALLDRYAEQCGDLPREEAAPPRQAEQGGAYGGSEAICVRKCDGYYFPLTPAMSSARTNQLRDLCQASCPNAETGLYSRSPHSDISNAVSADSGDRYEDLPNALKFTKKLEPSCSCRPPRQSWAEVLGHAEQILTEIEGERPGEGPLTAKQADERSRVKSDAPAVAAQAPPKPKKKPKPVAPPMSPFDAPSPF